MSRNTVFDRIEKMKVRTRVFAEDVRRCMHGAPKNLTTVDDMRQVIRSSGSVAANYLEACEALSPKDRQNRIKICRKEAAESAFWLGLLKIHIPKENHEECDRLQKEASELVLIFNAVVTRMKHQ